MRLAIPSALAMAAVLTLTLAAPAEAQSRRVYRDQTERITIYDENGRVVRNRITVRPRSYLDGGTEVLPGERKFMDYAMPTTHMNGAPSAMWDPTGARRFPLPMPFELPGYSPYSYW